MERILGLLDTLESMICDSPKLPFIGKTLINESSILQLIDKIRLVAQSEDKSFVKQPKGESSQQIVKSAETIDLSQLPPSDENHEAKAIQLIQQAYQISKEIRVGAEKYADEVLANLEATATHILRTIKNGRIKLSKSITESAKESQSSLVQNDNSSQ